MLSNHGSQEPKNGYKTTLDISNGFYSHFLAPESRDLTAFSALGNQRGYARLPMGYKNSPGVFAARIISILHEIDPDDFSFVDAIYLTDDEKNPHLMRVDRIATHFAKLGYKFNFAKSHIAFLTVFFPGYELNNEGRGLAPHFLEKCAAQLQPPSTLKKLQSLLFYFYFGRTYILDYAQLIKLLYTWQLPWFVLCRDLL